MSALRRSYHLHGIGVDVCCDDPAMAEHLWLVLEYLGLEASASRPAVAPVALHFSTQPGLVSIPPGACEVAQQDGLQAWNAESRLYLSCAQHTVRLDPASGEVTGTVPSSPEALRKDLILYSLLALLRRRGYFTLHAACVARDGAGYLFVAACNSGKSTNAYSLVRQGWDYLSDDSILLRPHGEGGSSHRESSHTVTVDERLVETERLSEGQMPTKKVFVKPTLEKHGLVTKVTTFFGAPIFS